MTTVKWILVLVLGIVPAAWASPDAKPQSTAPKANAKAKPAEGLFATVMTVKGRVRARRPGKQSWQPIKQGDRLPAGTIVRCGLGGKAMLKFSDGSELQVVRGCVRINRMAKEKQKVVTRIGLAYGAVRAEVERGTVQSDFAIRSPVATLSVRGTRGIYYKYWRGMGQIEIGLKYAGKIVVQRPAKWAKAGPDERVVNVGEQTDQDLSLPVELTKQDAEVNFLTQTGLSQREKRQLTYRGAGRGGIDPTLGSRLSSSKLGGIFGPEPKDDPSDDPWCPDDPPPGDCGE